MDGIRTHDLLLTNADVLTDYLFTYSLALKTYKVRQCTEYTCTWQMNTSGRARNHRLKFITPTQVTSPFVTCNIIVGAPPVDFSLLNLVLSKNTFCLGFIIYLSLSEANESRQLLLQFNFLNLSLLKWNRIVVLTFKLTKFDSALTVSTQLWCSSGSGKINNNK